MTIERSEPWGAPGQLPPGGVAVGSDAAAREIIENARRAGEPIPVLGLLGGDLCRTLGGTGDAARLHSPAATTYSIDLGSVLVDGRLHWFVAHLVARRSWWRGRTLAVMNAQWLGSWDLGPRAHPGDGMLDVSDADLSVQDRLKARNRVRTGTHVPHPAIRTIRVAAAQFELAPTLDVYLDGTRLVRAESLSVRVEPDALTVVV